MELTLIPWSRLTFPYNKCGGVWIKHKSSTANQDCIMIIRTSDGGVHGHGFFIGWSALANIYIQLDGSPCGLLVNRTNRNG